MKKNPGATPAGVFLVCDLEKIFYLHNAKTFATIFKIHIEEKEMTKTHLAFIAFGLAAFAALEMAPAIHSASSGSTISHSQTSNQPAVNKTAPAP